VLKWVIDDSAVEQEGTAEEMAAALQVVTAGDASLTMEGLEGPGAASTEVSTPIPVSGTATPAIVVPANAAKPAAGPAPDNSAPSVLDAVRGLEEVVGVGGGDVEMMGQKSFVEDEVQLAEQATARMVGMTVPEV
jgi:hypothetical protein